MGGSADTENLTVGSPTDQYGQNGDDLLTADRAGSLLAGGQGDDTIVGGSGEFNVSSGSDVLFGGSGDDTFISRLSDMNLTELQHDIIDGGSGTDTLQFTSTYLSGYSADQAGFLLGAFEVTGGEGAPRIVADGDSFYIDVTGLEGTITLGNYTVEFSNIERVVFKAP
ncbi:hypothetical protein [Falsiroseomonas sp.]|uniref:hypothetical protein n=1 Tax=Falsiroseomonas sp. TaxID=2870721 RepID=UPI003F71DD83